MRKWCPEPFDAAAVLNPREEVDFLADHTASSNPGFQPDSGLGEPESQWDRMTEDERAVLVELARESLRPEYDQRENELRESLRAEAEELRAAGDARFDIWTREFDSAHSRDRETLASEAAGLALALATKIIRDTAKVDPGMLVRTLETALYKVEGTHPLTVVMNPADALEFEMDPEVKSRLRVGEVVPDRRIERGGCQVRAGGREWDATITRQLESLGAVVEEAVEEWAAVPQENFQTGQGERDEPGLD